VAYPDAAELNRVRGRVRAAFPTLFGAAEGVLRFADDALDAWKFRRKPTPYELALLAHLARGTRTTHAVVQLSELLFGSIALMATRVAFETMISAYWLSLDPEARARQFDRFGALEWADFGATLTKLGWLRLDEVPAPFRDPARLQKLRHEFPSVRLGWTQTSPPKLIKGIAKTWPANAAADLRNYARVVGTLGSRHAHVGCADTADHVSVEDGRLHFALGPHDKDQHWVSTALKVAAWSYGQLFDLTGEHFHITDIDNWREHFVRLLARWIRVTKAQARGVRPNDPCPCGYGLKFKACHRDALS